MKLEKLNNKDFEEHLKFILDTISKMLASKGDEYVRNEDKLHNFNAGAEMKGTIPEEIIESFRLKHVISVQDIRNDIINGEMHSKELVIEKYIDIINYYVLELISQLHRIKLKKGQ